jgi:hypothetical protein
VIALGGASRASQHPSDGGGAGDTGLYRAPRQQTHGQPEPSLEIHCAYDVRQVPLVSIQRAKRLIAVTRNARVSSLAIAPLASSSFAQALR